MKKVDKHQNFYEMGAHAAKYWVRINLLHSAVRDRALFTNTQLRNVSEDDACVWLEGFYFVLVNAVRGENTT